MSEAIERLIKLTVDAEEANTQLRKVAKSTGSIADGFTNLRRLAFQATAALGAFRGVKSFIDTANQINLLQSSFAVLTDSAERGADLLDRSFKLVQDTGAGFDDVS